MRDTAGREWLPLVEAAAVLGVPASRIRKRIQRGSVRSYAISGTRWVCVTDAARCMRRGRPASGETRSEQER